MLVYLLLLIIAVVIFFVVLKLLINIETKTENPKSGMGYDIPDDHFYESENIHDQRNTEPYSCRSLNLEYQGQRVYDSGEEKTVLMRSKQQADYADEDATTVIDGRITYILLENINNPDIAFQKEIEKELLIGRKSGCDIIIDSDRTISSRHCKIVKNQDEFYVEDCNSSNGTYLNNERLVANKKISTGDILEIGHICFRLSIVVE